MSDQTMTLSLRGTKDAIEQIEQELSKNPENEIESGQALAQAGDPNTWVLAADILKTTLEIVVPLISALLTKHHIKNLTVEMQGKKVSIGEGDAKDAKDILRIIDQQLASPDGKDPQHPTS